MFEVKNYRPYRLVLSESGPHVFGGPARHSGVTPAGSHVSLDLLLIIDLTCVDVIRALRPIRYLPLYYPLKYDCGGAEVQYSVLSNEEIEVLYVSTTTPDDEESRYVRVANLPRSAADIVPLEYAEARILGFMEAESYFQPERDDMAILQRMCDGGLIRVGGVQMGVRNARDVVCRNHECKFSNRRVHFDVVASIPPIAVGGTDDFWHEFRGGDVDFCFGLCHYCGTVIAFNRAT